MRWNNSINFIYDNEICNNKYNILLILRYKINALIGDLLLKFYPHFNHNHRNNIDC